MRRARSIIRILARGLLPLAVVVALVEMAGRRWRGVSLALALALVHA
jgi:hypothetical protein